MRNFILTNTIAPAAIAIAFGQLNLSMEQQFQIAIGFALLLLLANLWFIKSQPSRRWLYSIVSLMNIVAFTFMGEVSIFTSIPALLNYLPG